MCGWLGSAHKLLQTLQQEATNLKSTHFYAFNHTYKTKHEPHTYQVSPTARVASTVHTSVVLFWLEGVQTAGGVPGPATRVPGFSTVTSAGTCTMKPLGPVEFVLPTLVLQGRAQNNRTIRRQKRERLRLVQAHAVLCQACLHTHVRCCSFQSVVCPRATTQSVETHRLTVYAKVLPTRALPGEAVMLIPTSNPLCVDQQHPRKDSQTLAVSQLVRACQRLQSVHTTGDRAHEAQKD